MESNKNGAAGYGFLEAVPSLLTIAKAVPPA
jgi:hypothetical protein